MKTVFIFLSLIFITSEQGLNQGFPNQNNINYNQQNHNWPNNPQMKGNLGQNMNNPFGQQNQINQNSRPNLYGQNIPNVNNVQNSNNHNQYIQPKFNNVQYGNNQNNVYTPNNNNQNQNQQYQQNPLQFNQQQFLKPQQQYQQHQVYPKNQQNSHKHLQQQQNQHIILKKNNNNESKIEEIYAPKNISLPKNMKSIYEQKNQNISLHYENCDNISIFCINGLTCKLNRCFTNLELNKTKDLGLKDKNICNDNEDCPVEQVCIKHRCVDDEDDVDISKRNEDYDPSVNLLFAGALFLNGRAYESGSNPEKTFNYDHFFQYIRDDIRNADLAIIDQETIFETDKKNFIKKVTNTPTELGDAIAKAGFKLVLHGTLYAFSKEEKGIKNTINFWKNKYPDIKILGINEDEKSINDDYYIFSKNGIKIGIVNFYGHGKKMIPENKQFYVNIMRKEKIKELLGKLSTETDFVIVCVNWGKKNSKQPTEKQIKWAKELAANGAKLIIGYHSSFVQQVSSVKSKGKRALVFWSLGHLINDNENQYSILGSLANITISKSDDGAYISDYNLIPTINHKDKGKHYSVYKLSQYSYKLFEISKINHIKFNRNNIVQECKLLMEGLADCY